MMKRRLHVGLLGAAAALALVVCGTAVSGRAASDPRAALDEGNRLFGDGQFEAAVAAYFEGYSPREPNPTLFYNLGTALHYLDRLPEAILWYRRSAGSASSGGPAGSAGSAGSARQSLWNDPSHLGSDPPGPWRVGDPWLQENLWLARRSLGSQVLPPGGLMGWLGDHTNSLRSVAIAIGWITLLLVVAGRLHGWLLIAAGILAVSTYGGAASIDRWGPRPAVILQDCRTSAGALPAGTELWVRPTVAGWQVSGSSNLTCPPEVVGLVFP